MGHRIDENTIPQKQILFRIILDVGFKYIVKKLSYIFKNIFLRMYIILWSFILCCFKKNTLFFSHIKLTVSFNEDVTLRYDEFRAATFIISMFQEGKSKTKGYPFRIWITLARYISTIKPAQDVPRLVNKKMIRDKTSHLGINLIQTACALGSFYKCSILEQHSQRSSSAYPAL